MINLSDAVFAIAMTLLVLEIKVPGGLSSGGLTQTMLGLGPLLLIYIFSFLIIGMAWNGHQRIYYYIERADTLQVWLNLLVLLLVTLVPATSALLGKYPQEPAALACLVINGSLINLLQFILWKQASHNFRQVSPDIPKVAVQIIDRITLLSAILYGIAGLAAFISIPLVYAIALVAIAASFAIPRWLARKAHPVHPPHGVHTVG